MEDLQKENGDWQQCKTQVFWGEIAPTDHLVQIYENDDVVLDSLEGFVTSGFNAGDSVIIIATNKHLVALNDRLIKKGFNIDSPLLNHLYIPLNAQETLERFMVNGWPDETLFNNLIKEIILLARGTNNRRVRAYGEMVAILWQQGHSGATVQLEHLWNNFCATEVFCLFCAYPKSGFTQNVDDSLRHICSAHTKMIAGHERSITEVFYKRMKVVQP